MEQQSYFNADFLTLLWTVSSAFFAVWALIFIFRKLTPQVSLKIISQKIDKLNLIILKIEIENISRVRIKKKSILLAVESLHFNLAENIPSGQFIINEWVDFSSAEEICKTTTHINPSECIRVERMYSLNEGEFLHVGLQVNRKTLLKKPPKMLTARWTSTFIFPWYSNEKAT